MFTHSRCVMTTRAGKTCRGRVVTVVGGIAVCEYHIGTAKRLYTHVCRVAETDPTVAACVLAADRDTRELNAINQS